MDVDSKEQRRSRVCVVDDDPSILRALAALLDSEFDVVAARSGRDALRLVRRDPPDLILLDLRMPDLDGFAVCRRLKDDPLTADVPVVFLTAQVDDETEVRGLSAGADDFIAKPPRGPIVLARVRNLVRMKRQADQLKREARRDSLTGLASRRHFRSSLHEEWLRARRQGKAVSTLMIDVDHFKAFNDHYGHLAGDGALSRVGQLLAAVANRPGDLAGRLGGEEFALLLPDTSRDGAMAVAHRAIAALEAAAIPHAASPVGEHLSFSIGVATWAPDGAARSNRETDAAPLDADAAADLLSRADAALYRAKRAGRRRACADGEQGDEASAQ